nr:hypothetical protein [Xylophilus sp. ASV27]
MFAHLLRRLCQSVLVLLAVSLVSFMVFRHIGDPTVSLLGDDASIEDLQALAARLGFDQPVPVQYLHYVGNVLRGEFGVSYRLKRPVPRCWPSACPPRWSWRCWPRWWRCWAGSRWACTPRSGATAGRAAR